MTSLALGIVSDEIDPDFGVAARHASGWDITRFEIRCLRSGRVPAVDPAEVREVAARVRDGAATITALSPGTFKHPLSRHREIEEELGSVLPRSIAMARELGAGMIITFGFLREEGEPEDHRAKAVEYLRRAADLAGKEGMKLAVENEPGFWCGTGAQTRSIIRAVGSPAFGANWDPCNAYGTDERPYPDGYAAIKDVIMNVHAKDTRKGALIQCVPIGEGVIDWQGQLSALVRDRPVQHVTIETHCHPLVENSRRNAEVLRALMQKA
jgi:sugar phosphate isomerase/epimerase